MPPVEYHMIGQRKFLRLFSDSFPVDSILNIDWKAPNGSSQNCVAVYTSIRTDPYYYNYDRADTIRAMLGIPSLHDIQGE